MSNTLIISGDKENDELRHHLHTRPSPGIMHHSTHSPFTLLRMWMFPEPAKRIDFVDFLSFVEPGDLLMFASDNFYAFLQDFFPGSPYSHVALPFFYDPDLLRQQFSERKTEEMETGKDLSDRDFAIPVDNECRALMLAESMPKEDGIVDCTTGTVKDGPMAVLASHRFVSFMLKYGYRIVWRKLNPRYRTINDEERRRRLQAILKVLYRKSGNHFNSHVPDLLSAAIPEVHVFPWFFVKGDFTHSSETFCSQLVAEILMEMGILKKEGRAKKTQEYSPGDFSVEVENLDLGTFDPKHGKQASLHHFYGPEILVDVNRYHLE